MLKLLVSVLLLIAIICLLFINENKSIETMLFFLAFMSAVLVIWFISVLLPKQEYNEELSSDSGENDNKKIELVIPNVDLNLLSQKTKIKKVLKNSIFNFSKNVAGGVFKPSINNPQITKNKLSVNKSYLPIKKDNYFN